MTERDRPAPGLSDAASARIYDYSLGGKDNYAADRDAALGALMAHPAARLLPRENRKFLRRAVRCLLDAGVRQFVDVGCGLPGKGNVHQVVHGVDPAGTVAYVDHDPVAVVHYRALLHAEPNAVAVQADARDPASVLGHPELTALIDFDRPVGVLMVSLLSLIPDEDDPGGVVRAFTSVLAPGGHLVVCDFTDEARTDHDRAAGAELMARTGITVAFRSRERLAGYFDGLELLEPGLVPAPDWRPDRPYEPATGWLLAGVGRKP
ncbi:SAM-dependent methyltransferase [Actinomadura macrotermitis]|uniref:S-adenosyl methyltransferase n=1 Tax=Actinomadura macrotermitis TaxID=2585200 RepID=A0A7K0C2R1_9ACTN|nr:SAM-dependent methyltransferase [Actinomadura macrotermitis]MQY07725.1 hypothetical protein [Actinomadura macrotermitis]